MELIQSLENTLTTANDALYRMRLCRARTMLDFADKDPIGFCQMVAASKAICAIVPEEVEKRYRELTSGEVERIVKEVRTCA